MKKFLLFGVVLIFLMQISCGPSAEEIEANLSQAVDSMVTVTENRIEKIQDFKNSLEALNNEAKPITDRLSEIEYQLAEERAKLEEIESYHLGRSLTTKDLQIKAQKVIIAGLEKEVDELNELFEKLRSQDKEIREELANFMTPEEKAEEKAKMEAEAEKAVNELESEMNK